MASLISGSEQCDGPSNAAAEPSGFRTARSNDESTDLAKPHTSVRMYYEPGGRSSGNIISWQ
jgi:hypothetical protein